MKPIVSKNSRIRHPSLFEIGEDSIVDDYCYFSTRVRVGRFCHIASGCSVGGGKERTFTLGDYSSLSSGVKVWCTSNDFVNDLVVVLPTGFDIGDKPVSGDVSVGNMCGVGSNTVIMPLNEIPEGVTIGALSFVPPKYEFRPWSVYLGNPIMFIAKRNRENVLCQAEELERQASKTRESKSP